MRRGGIQSSRNTASRRTAWKNLECPAACPSRERSAPQRGHPDMQLQRDSGARIRIGAGAAGCRKMEMEVIVGNDSSTDDTEAVLHTRYGDEPRVRVITTANRGAQCRFMHGARGNGRPSGFRRQVDAARICHCGTRLRTTFRTSVCLPRRQRASARRCQTIPPRGTDDGGRLVTCRSLNGTAEVRWSTRNIRWAVRWRRAGVVPGRVRICCAASADATR